MPLVGFGIFVKQKQNKIQLKIENYLVIVWEIQIQYSTLKTHYTY